MFNFSRGEKSFSILSDFAHKSDTLQKKRDSLISCYSQSKRERVPHHGDGLMGNVADVWKEGLSETSECLFKVGL